VTPADFDRIADFNLMARHSGPLPVNFSDIGDRRARSCLFFLFHVRVPAPRRIEPRRHSCIPAKLSSVYIHINSHTSRAILPLLCPLYIDSSIHFISLFLTAIFPTTNHLGTFAARLPHFFILLPHRFRRGIGESEMQAAPWRYTIISMIQSRHRLASASPCIR